LEGKINMAVLETYVTSVGVCIVDRDQECAGDLKCGEAEGQMGSRGGATVLEAGGKVFSCEADGNVRNTRALDNVPKKAMARQGKARQGQAAFSRLSAAGAISAVAF
jgi:hypothetical protein